ILAEAVRRAGAGKILFGSDGPWLHPGLELAKVRALKLRPAEERQILGQTLLRLMDNVDTWVCVNFTDFVTTRVNQARNSRFITPEPRSRFILATYGSTYVKRGIEKSSHLPPQNHLR